MAGLFGVVHFTGPSPNTAETEPVATAMGRWPRSVCRDLAIEGARFGRVETIATDSPLTLALAARGRQRAELFTSAGRLDNRDELRQALDLDPAVSLSDDAMMLAAYERWGEACAEHLLGDWSFAAWHPHERRLVLGRDHLGNTALYYARDGHRMAFASRLGGVLALPWVPKRLNEVRLARLLVLTLEEEEGSCTIYRDVHLLLPAHTLVATPQGEHRRRYWRLDPTIQIEGRSEAEHAEALLECLRTAVRCKVRGDRRIGSALSAGLDSTSISVLAARELASRDRRLTAFTAVPAVERPWGAVAKRIHDEGPLAGLVASSVSNIDHVLVDARDTSPIAATRAMLRITGQPFRAAGNSYWLLELLAEASRRGIEVLLTGQYGNSALSWNGPAPGWLTELQRGRVGSAARLVARRILPAPARKVADRYQYRQVRARWRLAESPWRAYSTIQAGFARDVGLGASQDDALSSAGSRDGRAARLGQGWQGASAWADLGAEFGVSVRDPSQDIRVIALGFSIPDRMWRGPMNRWIFRVATKGLLPDDVRLNPRRGLQAADLVDRLRRNRTELDDALAELDASPLARRCIDLAYCRHIATATDGPADQFGSSAAHLLMQGLSAGLFLAAFERTGVVV